MTDIGGFGIRARVVASNTFPSGFTVTQFADDSDPFDIPSLQIADKAMGVNGDIVTWSTANPIEVTLNVIPGSEDDLNLQVLFENNRPGKGKTPARDVIKIVAAYPDGRLISLTKGVITDGMPGNSIASAGRQKSKAYMFAFENVTKT